MAEATAGILIGLAVVIGLFIVIPLIVFLIVRKILSDRHRERMAMIENGMNGKYRQPAAEPRPAESMDNAVKDPETENEASGRQTEPVTPEPPKMEYYRRPARPEDSTVKWMYVFGGAAIGLLIASLTTNLLFTYTLIETKGLGLSIVVLSICIALYIYYVRKNKRKNDGMPFGPGANDRRPGRKEDTTYSED